MADDIDDLLDEVEFKFCKDSPTNGGKNSTKNRTRNLNKKDELDAMIEDIFTDNGPVYKPHSSINYKEKEDSYQPIRKLRKCYTVYLGGTQLSRGLSSATVKRSCDQLRCTACDFQVFSFDDYKWHSSCDYLFFRNNIPDFEKLKVNLIQKRGSRAYACQCSWRSITHIENIENDTGLKWVCGKHK
ncbi:cilia- and flagella-associated protein 418-like isoform X2 [Xenia sp. Carnegie-2017]|uniref:cilia- and flagella-associated protein 418-like isoform X2 n=1 Tax=Xenia sp. Carnegie-2017 TaxID=2897299 RepID=UPI001F034D39|nr:cilia- and flagella-associated protein 418-like isoform X2 [Xenia sp. Carnegie-2017]